MSRAVQRRIQLGLLVLGVIVTLMSAVMVAGAYRTDRLIDADMKTATAEVVEVTSSGQKRTTVVFQDGDLPFNPEFGLLYPTGLTEGQRIEVEYSAADPNLARPAGRTAALVWVPALSILVVGWAVVIVLMVAVAETGRRTRLRRRRRIRSAIAGRMREQAVDVS